MKKGRISGDKFNTWNISYHALLDSMNILLSQQIFNFHTMILVCSSKQSPLIFWQRKWYTLRAPNYLVLYRERPCVGGRKLGATNNFGYQAIDPGSKFHRSSNTRSLGGPNSMCAQNSTIFFDHVNL